MASWTDGRDMTVFLEALPRDARGDARRVLSCYYAGDAVALSVWGDLLRDHGASDALVAGSQRYQSDLYGEYDDDARAFWAGELARLAGREGLDERP
jgi:hypothetical protein